jgi:hypothetical protein
MSVEQHKRYLRFTTDEARRLASRLLAGMEDGDVSSPSDFFYDGWINGYYWAMHVMGANGRVRYPEGHAQAGQLIPGHFVIMAWQGPLSEAPTRLRDYVVTDAQIAATFPDGVPEIMG